MTHAVERAKERYGLDLTEADLASIRAAVASGKSVVVRRTPGGQWHMVRHAGKVLVAVVRLLAGGRVFIATFLPADALRSGAGRAHYGRRGKRLTP